MKSSATPACQRVQGLDGDRRIERLRIQDFCVRIRPDLATAAKKCEIL